jgi:peptidoglycan/LPS O-acetylase OafA/YrhL
MVSRRWLALGSLFALLAREWSDKRAGTRWFVAACAATAIVLFVIGTPLGILKPSTTFFGGVFWTTAVNLVYAAVLGCALLIGTSRFKWIVNRPLLQWFGYVSYGLYLIQMLAFDFVDHWIAKFFPAYYARMSGDLGILTVRFLASSAVAITAAFLSRRYFEERFLRLKDRLLVRPAKAVEIPARTAQQAAEESALKVAG